MSNGIKFFNAEFTGTDAEALRWIVDNILSPSPVGRAAYAEAALKVAARIGAVQYLIIAAGYDTFSYRQPDWAKKLKIFEIDHPFMSNEKQERVKNICEIQPDNLSYVQVDLMKDNLAEKMLQCQGFNRRKISFCTLLGICYYLPKPDFKRMIQKLAEIVPKGSSIVFDYPDENTFTYKAGSRTKKKVMMADNANEAMHASYSYSDMEYLLSECGFLIYEHLTPQEITAQYFFGYNKENPDHIMNADDNVNYCLAVRE
jgi:methyltransferase (TIGR00027 family)